MSCIHTGAEVYLYQYRMVVRTDIHRIGDCAVIRIAGEGSYGVPHDNETMYTVLSVGSGWFGRKEDHSTLVVPLATLGLPDNESDRSRWTEGN